MNYLVQGINQGAQNGAQAYLQMLRLADEEKSRKLREQETAAERRLRVQLAADSMANESKLLERRLKAEADGLTWRSTEADKDRTFTAGQELAKKFERDRREALARFDRYDRNNPENVFKAAQIKRLNAEADALSAKQPAEDYVTISEMSPDGLTRTTRKVPASTMPMLNQTQPAPSRVSTDPKIIQENATAYEAYLNEINRLRRRFSTMQQKLELPSKLSEPFSIKQAH